jgi:hypothetical protein
MPPAGGEREFNLTTEQGILGDEAARTSSPAPQRAPTGPLATGADSANVVPNTVSSGESAANDTPGAGLDLDRESYRGSEEPPPEASALKEGEYSNPLQVGGQLVQDAPITAQPNVPPGLVPLPGKEEFNEDDQGRDPYPVPVEGTGSRHVAYSAGEMEEQPEEDGR